LKAAAGDDFVEHHGARPHAYVDPRRPLGDMYSVWQHRKRAKAMINAKTG
jgi:hypothetical protein